LAQVWPQQTWCQSGFRVVALNAATAFALLLDTPSTTVIKSVFWIWICSSWELCPNYTGIRGADLESPEYQPPFPVPLEEILKWAKSSDYTCKSEEFWFY
jgi:hypothetical protein